MNHHEFIHRNIKAKLIKEGFSLKIANSAANYAIGYYNRIDGKKTRKGSIFDDVYFEAKRYVKIKSHYLR